jgi:hypothetical protein
MVGVASCGETPGFRLMPSDALRTHYLIDYEDSKDTTTNFANISHLIVFNPGARDAELTVSAYYEDHEPDRFSLRAPAGATTETISPDMPIRHGSKFALKVESSEPVICQAGLGWTNTGGRFGWGARTKSGGVVRESAKSYLALRRLSRHWFYPDGIVMRDGRQQTVNELFPDPPPHNLWIRESEYALLLNPGDDSATVTLTLHYGSSTRRQVVTVPPRRLKRLFMDPIAVPNEHYGVSVRSSHEIAFHWLRMMYWQDSDEPMTFWSVPGLPLEEVESSGDTS